MTRTPRWVVSGVLVVALVATAFTGCTSADRGSTPPALVGRWKGGAHSNGEWFYEFSADGGYRSWPVRSPKAVNTGTVVVSGDTVTFSNGGAPVTATWRLVGDVLLLDGQSYART